MISNHGTILKILSNDLSGLVKVSLSLKEKSKIVFKIFEGSKLIFKKEDNCEFSNFSFKINNPKFWELNNPFLYSCTLEIKALNFSENITEKFGIRKISTSKKYILLNNNPIFIKGYIRGIPAHDHKNNLNCSEENFYRKNIKAAKSFGFNFVRFHSTIPSETFFKVADEEGILIHIEMRAKSDLYNNLEEMVKTRNDFINENLISKTIDSLFNHPSLCVYCLGNEIKNLSSKEIQAIEKMIKSKDSSRLFLDTCAWGENNRPGVDIDVQHLSYFFPFEKHKGMYDDFKNLVVGDFNKGKKIKFNVPLIAHEVCHYTSLRDFKKLKEKFQKYKIQEPWWIDEELKLIKAKNFEQNYSDMFQASKEFQLSCWKTAFEEIRSSRILGGFHFLQFSDTDLYENSNGVVDCFDDLNYVKPSRFLDFNNDTVVLIKGIQDNYYGGKKLSLPIFISRFDDRKIKVTRMDIHITSQSFNHKVSFNELDISKKGFYKLLDFDFSLPEVSKLETFSIQIQLIDNKELWVTNNYKLWVYPKLKKYSYKSFLAFKNENFATTDNLKKCLSLLEKKNNVCLIYRSKYTRHLLNKNMKQPAYSFKATWNRYKPVIWDRGTNFGGLVNQQKLSSFGYEKYYDKFFKTLSEDCDKIILDGALTNATNLISGIDKCNRDRFDAYKKSFNLPEIMPDRTLRNFSYLFEINVGGAKLLVCGFNLNGLDKNEPSINYFVNSLIKYLNSKTFDPALKITIKDFKNYLKESAQKPVKERMMTQFWQLDNAPVETPKYWKDSRKYLLDKNKKGNL